MTEKNGEKILKELHEIISEDFKNKSYENGEICFFEKNENASGKFVKFGINENFLAFSLDQEEKSEKRVFPFFNKSKKDINSKNDGIIIFLKGEKICVFLLEIKSTLSRETKKKALSQLRKGKIFVDFLFSTYKEIESKPKLEYITRAGIFYADERKSVAKRPSTRKNEIDGDGINNVEFFTKKANESHKLNRFFI